MLFVRTRLVIYDFYNIRIYHKVSYNPPRYCLATRV
nr:MAG TPA: hypothetical protein [Caudoviricetes sp.]